MFIEWLSRLLCKLPIGLQLWFGDCIGIFWFDVLRIRRRTALANLDLAFPDKSRGEKIKIARASVCNIGRSFVEFLRIPALAEDDEVRNHWRKSFHVRGRENLEAALQRGRGACLLTAHIGNGDWATVGLSLHGIQLQIISKQIKLSWLNRFWFETRQSLGTEFIPDRGSSLSILKLLKKNKAVVFMLDQFLGPPIGIKTRFFGYETGTGAGLALLAGRSGAAVVPTYTRRTEQGETEIIFEPEIPFVEQTDKDETILHMTQIYCDQIEKWVRQIPQQWMWVHRRWKKYKH